MSVTTPVTQDRFPACGMRVYVGSSPDSALHSGIVKASENGRINRYIDAAAIDADEILVAIKRLFYLDPDVISISHISSSQAANAAVLAMETGHLVMTSIQAATVEEAKKKLLEWGVQREYWEKPHFIQFMLC